MAWSEEFEIRCRAIPHGGGKAQVVVYVHTPGRIFRGKCSCLPACLPAIWIGERAFLCQRRSEALPLLILGFIKIREGSWHVGILDFLRLYAAEGFARSDWRVSKGAAEFKTPL